MKSIEILKGNHGEGELTITKSTSTCVCLGFAQQDETNNGLDVVPLRFQPPLDMVASFWNKGAILRWIFFRNLFEGDFQVNDVQGMLVCI